MSNEQDRLAKKRFFALSAMRIVGALFIMAGFVLIRAAGPSPVSPPIAGSA